MTEEVRSYKSKYTGTCKKCVKGIEVGEMIQWRGKGIVFHWDCRPDKGDDTSSAKLEQDGFIFIDTETGGTDAANDAMCQIAMIATTPSLIVLDSYATLVCPPMGLNFSPGATAIHGLTWEKLEQAPDELAVWLEVLAFVEKYPNFRVAGYNWPFDKKFMAAMAERVGLRMPPWLEPAFDVLPQARDVLGNKTVNHKLGTVAKHFGYDADNAHDALCDLFLTICSARSLEAPSGQ